MKVVGISFSYAANSLQTRGLKLLQEKLDMQVFDMLSFQMPVCNSNKSDGNVPNSVEQFVKQLEEADVLIFAVSEATSHYSAGFKNAMDWLVVKSKFNARLGTDYAITDKPIFVVTFTPTAKAPNGGRHFGMTTELLQKLGADVKECHLINDSWKTVIPGGFNAVKSVYSAVYSFLGTYTPSSAKTRCKDDYSSLTWLKTYNEWDLAWRYELKSVHRVNGIPWPRINDREKKIVEVPLKEDYKYMGYDTSPQPIEYAKEVWAGYDNIEYRCASMYNPNPVEFDVDCVIWSGVLLYDPQNHMQLFRDVTFGQYNAKHAIIQEPCKEQDADKWLPNMKLNTIEQDLHKYANEYNYKDWIVEAQVFSGRRRIAHIWI